MTSPATDASFKSVSKIDEALLQAAFPGKDLDKIRLWLKVLHDEEVETVQDALPFLTEANKGTTGMHCNCP
jgi:hypothetical protein